MHEGNWRFVLHASGNACESEVLQVCRITHVPSHIDMTLPDTTIMRLTIVSLTAIAVLSPNPRISSVPGWSLVQLDR